MSLVVLGGMGSMAGTVVAAFHLSVIAAFVGAWVGATWSTMTFFLALFVILLVRPQGSSAKNRSSPDGEHPRRHRCEARRERDAILARAGHKDRVWWFPLVVAFNEAFVATMGSSELNILGTELVMMLCLMFFPLGIVGTLARRNRLPRILDWD